MTKTTLSPTPPLDTVFMVSTPENVAFDFRLAGPFYRFLALVIDLMLVGAILVALLIGMLWLQIQAMGLFFFLAFFIWWGYGGLMEALWNGQTLGKKAVGIRVVSDSGLAINAGQAILRNILRSADLIPPYFPGVISMLVSRRFQRLGDLAAETIVVIDGARATPRPPKSNAKTEAIRPLIPIRFRPDPALIDALAAFVGRRNDLSVPRQRELAKPLADYFIRAWSLPPNTRPELLLCAIYDQATTDQTAEESRSKSNRRPRRPAAEIPSDQVQQLTE